MMERGFQFADTSSMKIQRIADAKDFADKKPVFCIELNLRMIAFVFQQIHFFHVFHLKKSIAELHRKKQLDFSYAYAYIFSDVEL